MQGSKTKNYDPAYSARVHYNEKNSALYQHRNRRRDRAEMALIEKVFRKIPAGSVLDVPCGGGRIGIFLAEQGYQVTCADFSQAMVDIAQRNSLARHANITVGQQDIEDMTYADKAFNTVVCFRLFHHFPNEAIRARAVQQMCRVSRDRVVLSYFSPFAFSAVERKVRRWIKGRAPNKFATTLKEVRGYFEACGFEMERDFAQLPFVHTLHVAVFKRSRSGGAA